MKFYLLLLVSLFGVGMLNHRLRKDYFNVKLFILNLIFFFTVLTISNFDYEIASLVENVHYSTDSTFVCEIALKDGDTENEIKPNSYHRSKDTRLCEFAERCRNANQRVKLFGKSWIGLTDLVGIEYADTNAIH